MRSHLIQPSTPIKSLVFAFFSFPIKDLPWPAPESIHTSFAHPGAFLESLNILDVLSHVPPKIIQLSGWRARASPRRSSARGGSGFSLACLQAAWGGVIAEKGTLGCLAAEPRHLNHRPCPRFAMKMDEAL